MDEHKFYEILGQTKLSFGDINDFPHYETMDASGLPIFSTESNITTEEFKVRYDEVECKYSITKLRVERNRLLTESDWTQSRDLKLEDDDKWVSYRQALRDLPSHYSGVVYDMAGNFTNVVFPAKPEEPVVVQEEKPEEPVVVEEKPEEPVVVEEEKEEPVVVQEK